MKKSSDTEAELKKNVAYKKNRVYKKPRFNKVTGVTSNKAYAYTNFTSLWNTFSL